MKYILFFSIILLSSCSNAFVNHKLEYKKSGECNENLTPIKMTSNINGERYEFQQCMNENFNGKDYTVTRRGDSIMVDFPRTVGALQSNFSITLDIDAKPSYHHIFLDGREVTVVPANL